MSDLKPLRTKDEIDAAYPEHKKLMDADEQIKALIKFVRNLNSHFYFIAERGPDCECGNDLWISYQPAHMNCDDHKLQEFIWRYLDIDPEKIWSEKADMLDQLGKRGL